MRVPDFAAVHGAGKLRLVERDHEVLVAAPNDVTDTLRHQRYTTN